ncbi:hypothetical protein GOODEAATRI_007116 [Goodea atripinnis]|uniref:Uncharacterized protein n=1 Tax=Goodea atripinnis TaxID=208336 RepID=A0ABV0NSH5_9TELE
MIVGMMEQAYDGIFNSNSIAIIIYNNSPSPSLKALFFLVKQVLQVTGDIGFVTGEASHRTGGDDVIHTEVYIVSDTVNHGIDVLSMWLAQCVPVCSLKATLQGFFSFL